MKGNNPPGTNAIPLGSLLRFDNSYARLPERFFVRQAPTPVPTPKLIRLNEDLARELGIDPARLGVSDAVEVLAGNRVPETAEPLAMAYAGHQFGNWVPQLGDGRAVLLGEIIGRDGVRRDVQLKGAGRTPFSRGGDGRAVLGPVLREYIVSEAMAALGIPTTRALAAVTTGQQIMRQGLQSGAVLTRIARSHVRIGTFEFFASRGDGEAVRLLADYVISRHYCDAAQASQPYRALLDAVVGATAELVARWMQVGFIHGVMNTDNVSIAGETIDFGPCAFMDAYDPATVFSSIDVAGRYAYGNQPRIAHWNLVRLAQALLPLLGENEETAIASAQEVIDSFPTRFDAAYLAGFRRKLGLAEEREGDSALVRELLGAMENGKADFTLTFRRLSDWAGGEADADKGIIDLFADLVGFRSWTPKWRARLALEGRTLQERQKAMRAVNPAYIPRNHRVEAALAAAQADDFSLVDELLAVLANPYDERAAFAHYADPPKPDEIVQATFCGT